ncbi:MAG: hypothetical protein PHQ12_11330 [Chthoniobacteraceae bacterium]|nr:hypothetical protein [Chthoniobacteraceae bacterium]
MGRAPQKILAVAACVAAFGSTAIHAVYFCIARALPVYPSQGGITFTLSMRGWIVTSAALTLGALGAAFLITSCIARPREAASLVNTATVVFLIPAGFTFYHSVALLLGLM